MRSVLRFALLLLALLASAPGARAQEATPSAAPTEAVAAAAQAGALPARPAPPRTLRDHWHVFVAFSLAWLLLFGYVVSVGRRFARVEEELRRAGA